MKFPIDMNLSPLWVSFLPGEGFEAAQRSTIGDIRATDSEILEFAAADGWIVFTHDLDFGMLLAALRVNRPSVVQVRRQDVLPSAIGGVALVGGFGGLEGALVFSRINADEKG
jgi:predicted nuclease of predicted toxin-antitoxin system